MSIPIFIDGAAGTTGLLLRDLLQSGHPEFELLEIAQADRKNAEAKRVLMGQAQCVVLCLPDDAAVESASLAAEVGVRVLDASSAHRVAEGWVYGLPELHRGEQRKSIATAARVSNPGCYATSAILLLHPLSTQAVLDPEAHVSIVGLSGYSGGGRKLLTRFGDAAASFRAASYSHGVVHKHVKEIRGHSPLTRAPHFQPVVLPFERGMVVVVQLAREALRGDKRPADALEALHKAYDGEPCIEVRDEIPSDPDNLLMLGEVVGTNRAILYAFASGDDVTLVCHLDNLGKGASMAAIQNLNVMFGFDEALGLPQR